MARSHLTLAALATSAVPGLDVVHTSGFGAGRGEFDSAIVTDQDGGRWVVRMPRTERAEQEQSADMVALRALGAGVRSRLPFDIPGFAGQIGASGTRAVVYSFVPGSRVDLGRAGVALATDIGRAIAGVHALPVSVVSDAGLPTRTSIDCLRDAATVVDHALATGLVPAMLGTRWEDALEDTTLWQFQPTVANGSLAARSVLVDGDRVVGILGWQELRVTDPARDLHWVLALHDPTAVDAAFDAYVHARGVHDRQLRRRATIYAELEVARWLLFGKETRSTEVVDDAVEMLHAIVDDLQHEFLADGEEAMTRRAGA